MRVLRPKESVCEKDRYRERGKEKVWGVLMRERLLSECLCESERRRRKDMERVLLQVYVQKI